MGLLTPDQAAEYLQVTPRTFRESYRLWGIPAVKLGHRTVRFREEDLAAFARRMARRAA